MIMENWTWAQYYVFGIQAFGLVVILLKEGALHAKGQSNLLTATGVVTPLISTVITVYALHVGGFW